MALWNGRFERDMDKATAAFTESLSLDQRLYPYDIWQSRVYARMLARQQIIAQEEADQIEAELKRIKERIDTGEFVLDPAMEDVHMNIEHALIETLGSTGAKIHAGRSRNDQIATDERMFLRDQIDHLQEQTSHLQTALVTLAEQEESVVIPGYTHLQQAQPVLFAHHLLAYVEMLERDKDRLIDARKRVNLLPLGSSALAGSTLPLDRHYLAEEMAFDDILENSMDAVGDRDYIIEFLSALAALSTHISRLAEDFILWSSSEFSFVELDDAFCTGSSLMPQKKNPDVAELARGKTGRVFGALIQILTLLKGLPLTYNRDLQEDKAGLLDALDSVRTVLTVLPSMVASAHVHHEHAASAVNNPYLMATDVAEWLVQQGVPFREAHKQVGAYVKYCQQQDVTPESVPLSRMQEYIPAATEDCYNLFSAKQSVERRCTVGGTAPQNVHEQIQKWKHKLD